MLDSPGGLYLLSFCPAQPALRPGSVDLARNKWCQFTETNDVSSYYWMMHMEINGVSSYCWMMHVN